ncbi:MAG: hypothetical protein LLG37_01020 [Spirochaetia bacterium]|nr:hypothetical protein [Spirochaetia bacterium]
MKKTVITLLFLLLALDVFAWKDAAKKHALRNMTTSGDKAADFVVGFKGGVTYRLNDMAVSGTVILSFTDNTGDREKIGAAAAEISGFLKSRPNIVWINVQKQDSHAVIEELTSRCFILYRCAWRDIPKSYKFPFMPSVLILDRDRVIQFVYCGYSPTVGRDIEKWIGENLK